MAKNRVYERNSPLSVACTQPAVPVSGNPVLFGQRPGVALTDERSDGTTTVAFEGVFQLAVKGENAVPANVAINAGDVVYYDAAATPTLNVDATNGVRFGYALDPVASGATTTIRVAVGY